jgi:Clathrin adaptor complex small chain
MSYSLWFSGRVCVCLLSVSVCLYLRLGWSMSVGQSLLSPLELTLSLSLSVSLCLSLSLSVSLSLCLSLSLSVSLSLSLSLSLSRTQNLDGINYMYIKKNGLYFLFTSKTNVSPAMVTELLVCITKVFKDYCGVLTEESIRSNFVLLYELLDEMLDYGYVQGTSSDMLKSYVFNEPVIVQRETKGSRRVPNNRTVAAAAVDKPIHTRSDRRAGRNEIFVDIYERISITFNSSVCLSCDLTIVFSDVFFLVGIIAAAIAAAAAVVVQYSHPLSSLFLPFSLTPSATTLLLVWYCCIFFFFFFFPCPFLGSDSQLIY